MDAGTTAAPRRWWQDLRWLTAIVVAAFAGSILWGLFGPEPRIVVSRETTFITEPLRPDGLPDYRTRVLDLMGRGTPPEDNAAVGIVRAAWPMDLDPQQLTALCRGLGIPDTPPDVAPLVATWNDKALIDAVAKLVGPPLPEGTTSWDADDERRRRADEVCDAARVVPWRSDDCPPLAAWVARQAPALDLVVAASTRPRYAMPPPDLLAGDPEAMILVSLASDLQAVRDVARSLLARAMLHAGEGRVDESWRDIHAAHRLGRLLALADQDGFFINRLMSIAIGATANQATVTLLETPGLSAGLVATMRRDLDALPRRGDVAAIDIERLGQLDLVVQLAGMTRANRTAMGALAGEGLRFFLMTSLDWNVVLRAINAADDRIVAAARIPDRAERRRAFDAIDAEWAATVRTDTGWRRAIQGLRRCTSRSCRSAEAATRLMVAFAPTMHSILDARDRAEADFEVIRAAAALAEYRLRGLGGAGRPYPDSLDALVPDVVAAVPSDPLAAAPLRYERRGDGYLLYSVGTDGVDDGGTNGEVVQGEWRQPDDEAAEGATLADLVVRMPRPRRTIIPAQAP